MENNYLDLFVFCTFIIILILMINPDLVKIAFDLSRKKLSVDIYRSKTTKNSTFTNSVISKKEQTKDALLVKKFGSNTTKQLSGIWICQYEYFSYINEKQKVKKTETQIVLFNQKNNVVIGETLDADEHPEDFEGYIINDRILQGDYCNQYQTYHGSFQFIISKNNNNMKGKWLGHCRNGVDIEVGEWRWIHETYTTDILPLELERIKQKAKRVNLFSNDFVV